MDSIQQIIQQMGAFVPRIIGAIAILVVGWILAAVIAKVIRNMLSRISLDTRLAKWLGDEGDEKKTMGAGKSISKVIYYLIMIFVLIAAFQALGITIITQPLTNLLNELFLFLPKLLGGVILLLIAWIIARILRMLVARSLAAARIDERLNRKTEGENIPLAKTVSEMVYWLVFLMFLPAILSTLQLNGLLTPVVAMMNKVLAFMPNIITAALIVLIGWFMARIARKIITGLLAAAGIDRVGAKTGTESMFGRQKLSGLIGMLIFVLILIPVVVAGLNVLRLDAVTQPVSAMFQEIILAFPNILVAVLILVVSYIAGRFLSGLLSSLLAGVGFNNIFARLGIGSAVPAAQWTPSAVAGYLVLIAIMLFAVIQAADQLGFQPISNLISQLLVLLAHIALGLVIFGVGLFLSNLAYKRILASPASQPYLMAISAKVAIIVFAGAIALRQMGLANEIINLAFGLMLGAIAVAAAIALGVGGRDVASRELNEWVQTIKARKIRPE